MVILIIKTYIYYFLGVSHLEDPIFEYFSLLGKTILEQYGQSESCGLSTINTLKEFRFNSAGKRVNGLEIKIADDGEILVKGANVFKGYFKDNEETENSLKDGYLYSGDLGSLDNDGFLYIKGRKKDVL